MRDGVLLHQGIIGWDVEYDSDAADYNYDGKVNMRDLVALQQYING
ncbi:MAG: dockerin type I domain-containing protein [Clostridiales bacterium]|nr:dockerin type I domain-containing protein [Clostridiales bacterium]